MNHQNNLDSDNQNNLDSDNIPESSSSSTLMKRPVPETSPVLSDAFAAVRQSETYQRIRAEPIAPSASTSSAPVAVVRSKSIHCVLVHPNQKGNPLLQFVTNVPYEFDETIVPDFVVGRVNCMLYLSMRYHRLYPDYIYDRIKKLGDLYTLRVLLLLFDVEDGRHVLREISKLCFYSRMTLILCWSLEEAGRYIEIYKTYENKPADALKERIDSNDIMALAAHLLTAIPGVNKTDVVTLMSTFKCLKGVSEAKLHELVLLPGFGERKAKRVFQAFNQPFQLKDGDTIMEELSLSGDELDDEDIL